MRPKSLSTGTENGRDFGSFKAASALPHSGLEAIITTVIG